MRHAACLAGVQDTLPQVEDRMARWTRLVPAFAAALALAACGHGSNDTPLSPSTPRFDAGGGSTLGGNAAPQGDSVSTRTRTASPTSADAPVVPDDSTHRGGSTLGGN
jgi:hypothetical protein